MNIVNIIANNIAELLPSVFRWFSILVIITMYTRAYQYFDNADGIISQFLEKSRNVGINVGKGISTPIIYMLTVWLQVLSTFILYPILQLLSFILSQTIEPFINTFIDKMNLQRLDKSVAEQLERIKGFFYNLGEKLRVISTKIDNLFSLINTNDIVNMMNKNIIRITNIAEQELQKFIFEESAKIKEFVTESIPNAFSSFLKKINFDNKKINKIFNLKNDNFSSALSTQINNKFSNISLNNNIKINIDEEQFRQQIRKKYDEIEHAIRNKLSDELKKIFNPNIGIETINKFLSNSSHKFKNLTNETKNVFTMFNNDDINNNKVIEFISNIFNKKNRGGPCLEKCYYTELIKDFRYGRRNWYAVRLHNKTSESRCDFPYDWRIEYNTDGRKGETFLQMHNGCRADFYLLRANGEKIFYGNQTDYQNGNFHMFIKDNPFYKLSTIKWNAIKNICNAWKFHGDILMTDFEPDQIDNIIQDLLLTKLATNKKMLNAYISLPDNLLNQFIKTFTSQSIKAILRVAKSINDTGVRESWSIKNEKDEIDVNRYLIIYNNMKNDPMFQHKASGVYYLRGILLNF